tara:strand:+ start:551 stop:994 length:444 start_codon:yes stop_codon:yes gene_type:complete
MTKEEKELLEIEKGLNQINEEVGGMMDKIKGLNKVAEFEQMEKTIGQLKNLVQPDNPDFGSPTAKTPKKKTNIDTTPPPIDGETCMHGNSWHSNCMDCDELDDMEIALNEMANIIDNEPNDKELGKKIRDFYLQWIKFSEQRNKIDI